MLWRAKSGEEWEESRGQSEENFSAFLARKIIFSEAFPQETAKPSIADTFFTRKLLAHLKTAIIATCRQGSEAGGEEKEWKRKQKRKQKWNNFNTSLVRQKWENRINYEFGNFFCFVLFFLLFHFHFFALALDGKRFETFLKFAGKCENVKSLALFLVMSSINIRFWLSFFELLFHPRWNSSLSSFMNRFYHHHRDERKGENWNFG